MPRDDSERPEYRRHSVTFPVELMDEIVNRAKVNGRTINMEIRILVESALASEYGDNIEIMRLLQMAKAKN